MYLFLTVIEKTNKHYSAYCPDLAGCIATGNNRKETEHIMYEAVEMHVQGLLEDNLPIPENVAIAEYKAVGARMFMNNKFPIFMKGDLLLMVTPNSAPNWMFATPAVTVSQTTNCARRFVATRKKSTEKISLSKALLPDCHTAHRDDYPRSTIAEK